MQVRRAISLSLDFVQTVIQDFELFKEEEEKSRLGLQAGFMGAWVDAFGRWGGEREGGSWRSVTSLSVPFCFEKAGSVLLTEAMQVSNLVYLDHSSQRVVQTLQRVTFREDIPQKNSKKMKRPTYRKTPGPSRASECRIV